jgi:hypothetical protein
MTSRLKNLTIRDSVLLLVIGAVVYVTSICVYIVIRIAPTSRSVAQHGETLMREYSLTHERLIALRQALVDTRSLLQISEG